MLQNNTPLIMHYLQIFLLKYSVNIGLSTIYVICVLYMDKHVILLQSNLQRYKSVVEYVYDSVTIVYNI